MSRLLLLCISLLFAVAGRLSAQDEHLRMRFDFTNVSGADVKDNISGITAHMLNSASVVDMGRYKALSLGNESGYLDMTKAAGTLFAGMNNYSVSVYYRVDNGASLSGAGYFLWAFSTLAACTSNGGAYTAYRLNAQRMASSTGGFSNEKGYSIGKESVKGEWVHMAYTQDNGTGKLYVNGIQKATIASMPLNSALYGTTAPTCCWIGRPQFSADSYLKNTLVTDFRLYDTALTDSDIKTLAAVTSDLDDAYLKGKPGDPTALLEAIAEAKKMVADPATYLPDAISEMEYIITIAEKAAASQYSQFYMDEACKQLKSAIEATRSTAGIILPDPDALAEAYNTNKGFIHPGGMHTQADFERIKLQLKNGNQKVIDAYNILKGAEYAQPGIQTWPVETIVRGGGKGENYINAARGATMAYQNALRWKIEGNKACANTAVNVLMAWARRTKAIGGNSNWALAAGLYGYQFAQAAELMRDYEGWAREDFELFKKWMLDLWYPSCMRFLRTRNDTWRNTVGNQGGPRPGHYWSNWGLCNACAVITIGILCDDVFIYNQGMSYMKYDQVGTFKKKRTANPILNDGLTEFLGNLVVTTAPYESDGAYGEMGQMQESGRDAGHASMALGLAVDIAHTAFNQGDDMFAYMDHRLAAGIEFTAACTQSVQNLPWTNYKYVDCRTAWHNGWLMGGPAQPAHVRNYWGTVIGIYEGVKGVKMPYSEMAYNAMGIDGGGYGGTSGAYDHLGYSVLLNTYEPQLLPENKKPTELSPKMEYSGEINENLIPSLNVEKELGNINGQVISHNELGGLVNTYVDNSNTSVPRGETVKLMPQLPVGEEDTGMWQWNTGETTRDITVNTDRSYVYRVTYTNKNGAKSYQNFAIAVANDCTPTTLRPVITYDGKTYNTETLDVLYGQSVTLSVNPTSGMGDFLWSTGHKTRSFTTVPLTTSRTYTVYYTNQGKSVSAKTFHLNVIFAEPYMRTPQGGTQNITESLLKNGESVTLGMTLPSVVNAEDVTWSNGAKGAEITLDNMQTSGTYTATFTVDGIKVSETFTVYVATSGNVEIKKGDYVVKDRKSGKLLTAHGKNNLVTFEQGDAEAPGEGQTWFINTINNKAYNLSSLPDSLIIGTNCKLSTLKLFSYYFEQAAGTSFYSMHTGTTAKNFKYWSVNDDGSVNNTGTSLVEYNFEIIPAKGGTGIDAITTPDMNDSNEVMYDLSGRRVNGKTAKKGIYIRGNRKFVSL